MRLIDADGFKNFLQALVKAGAPYDDVISLLDKNCVSNINSYLTSFSKQIGLAMIINPPICTKKSYELKLVFTL